MDKVYAFDKITKLGTLLGEIQTEFNMSFVIDGTKDSAKMVVHSWNENEIEPYTIIYHANTQSWWIVSHDKVGRYQNEEGFLYIHNLTLLGAIELLNARDLTDCGFNQNTYTVYQFISRLFALSNFEYSLTWFGDYNFRRQKVKFVKTFENYTLLSALREFLDGYNMAAKLEFGVIYNQSNDTYTLDNAILTTIPKTGDSAREHSMDDFDDTRETKTMDKNSFGSTVVSNAENVISTEHKTYPTTGSVKLSSKQYKVVDGTNLNEAVIRLPSKVFKGNWLKIIHPLKLTLSIQGTVTHFFEYTYSETEESFNKAIDFFADKILSDTGSQNIVDTFLSYVDDNLKATFDSLSTITLYNDNNINAFTGDIIKGDNVPYLADFIWKYTQTGETRFPVMFTDKNTKSSLKNIKQGIAWERGSNEITGFDIFDGGDNLVAVNSDYQGTLPLINFTQENITIRLSPSFPYWLKDMHVGGESLTKQISKLSFIVDYIPMTDLKVKVDNTREKRDIQLYNQNGRLTDNVALSKLINSYSKEISSDTITRYMQYYSFNDIPKVGDIVYKGNINYVINNVSLDFMQNENETYYIEAEITMSKYVSTKSLLTNPNTNIRDYGIPQNFNVKRKQLYRDYYELAYQTFDSANQDTPYLASDNIFNFANTPNEKPNFIGVIKLGYDNLVEGENNWYYQLETTTYMLDKMLYVVLDFNDNNIIGYGSQNVFSGFDVSRIFTGQTDTLNTPISYVDENGKVKSVDLLLCAKEQITSVYDQYQEDTGGQDWEGSLYNYSVFIPGDIYNACLDNKKIEINEPNYNKDAIEVPVFEYVCQIDDSEDVLIGDNILTQREDCVYFYSFVEGYNLTQNNCYDSQSITPITSPIGWQITNGVTIEYEKLGTSKLLRVKLFNYQRYDVVNNTWSNVQQMVFTEDKDYAIFRHAYNLRTQETITDLVLIAKKVPFDHLTLDKLILTLEINHYKLN